MKENKFLVKEFLNNENEKIEDIPNLKCVLYPHQRTIIKEIHNIEQNRFKEMKYKYSDISNKNVLIESNAVILSEPFGSGKTLMILGLIAYKQTPRLVPELCSVIYNTNYSELNLI